jgi:hypothetical protein
LRESDYQSGKPIRNEGFLISLSIAHQKSSIANEFSRRLIFNGGFPMSFLGNPSTMEDFSPALLEDGQELGSSHGFLGKLISNQGILVVDQGQTARDSDTVFQSDINRFDDERVCLSLIVRRARQT